MEKKIPLEDHRSSASYLLKTLFLIDGLSDDPLKNVDILVENGVITKVCCKCNSILSQDWYSTSIEHCKRN